VKVTIENEHGCAVLSDDKCIQADDTLDLCVKAMIGVGFHADSIREAIINMAYVFEQEEK